MTNRRKLRQPTPDSPVSELIASLDGARIPGGCDACDAYQVVQARAGHRNVHLMKVFHDDGCPVLTATTTQGGTHAG
jgi:hypothetical protein